MTNRSDSAPRKKKLLLAAMILALLALAAGAVLLWENRKGTPGEPADFYYTVLRDGVALNRRAMERNAQYGYPQYLVVDLSQTGLGETEKANILQKLEEDCAALPNLTVLDLPMGDRGSYFLEQLAADVSASTGASVDGLMHRAGLYPLTFTLKTPLPPAEELGVSPIQVNCLMWWGGWAGRDTAYIHYPSGWKVYEKGLEYQIS